jgi:uncharacterized protein (DUF2236 family)
VRERDLPPTWTGFRAYFDEMVAEGLVRTQSVARVLETIRHAPAPPVRVPDLVWRAISLPAGQALWLGGAGLMSPSLRARLGVSWSGLDEAQFRTLGTLSRSLTSVLPKRLKVMGPAQLRWREGAITHGPLGARNAP